MHKISLGLAALAFGTIAATAQTPLAFSDVDTDGNGELSFAELQVVWPDLTQEEFAAADLNGSGGLDANELGGLQPSSVPAPDPAVTMPAPDAGTTAPAVPDSLSSSPDS